MNKKQFEDFLTRDGLTDIFSKAHELNEYLTECPNLSVHSLGVKSLSGPQSESLIKTPTGEDKKVVMLGSNSYLDLGRHPLVIAAASKAVEKYGYGMGAVSLYA